MRLSIVSRGDARKTRPDKVFEGTFQEFAEHFTNYQPNRGKRDGYFVRGELNGTRKNANLPHGHLLILDGDQSYGNEESAPDPEKLHKALKLAKINHFIYSSHSYDPTINKFKWRCVIPCEMAQSQLKPTLDKMFEFLASIEFPLLNVKENWTWSQPWFFPNRDKDDGHYVFLQYHKGEDYEPSGAVESTLPASTSIPNKEASGPSHRENLAAIREGISYYKELQNVIWGFAKDGRPKDAALADAEMIMFASKAAHSEHEHHDKWKSRLQEMPTYIEQAFNAQKADEIDLSDLPDEDNSSPQELTLPWPPGLTGKLCKDFYEMAPHPNQEIAIMGGITLIAGVAGRKFNVMGTGLNIYATLLADSGIGKAILKDGINLALRSANAMHGSLYIGSSRFTGPKAMFDMLMSGHSRVCVLEESGLMSESKAGDQAGMSRVMLDLYTSSGSHQWAGGEAYSDKNNSIKPIQAPALTLLNVSTPKSYLKAMKDKSAELSGEIARMWIIRSMKDKPYLNVMRKSEFSKDVIDNLAELTKLCFDRQIPENNGKVRHITFDQEKAQKDSNEFVDLENKYRREGDHLRRTLCSRAFVKIMKLASICSVFNNKEEIGDEEYSWAREVVGYEMKFIQDTFTHESSDDMLQIVKGCICPVIIKILKAAYGSSSCVPPENIRKMGIFTHTNITQATNSNAIIRELDDDPSRQNPKRGVEKILDYMIRSGYLTVVDKLEMKTLGCKSPKGYKITEDFKTILQIDLEEKAWRSDLDKKAPARLKNRRKNSK